MSTTTRTQGIPRGDHTHKPSDDPTKSAPKQPSAPSSRRPSSSSRAQGQDQGQVQGQGQGKGQGQGQGAPNSWIEEEPLDKHTREIKHVLQMKTMNGDSGHNSSQSSPSSSPKSPTSSIPDGKQRNKQTNSILKSPQDSRNSSLKSSTNPKNTSSPKKPSNPSINPKDISGDTVTYADLDPRAFMLPKNRVLPPMTVSSSKSTYASISVSRSHLV